MKEEVLIPKKARVVGGLGEGTRKIYISKDVYQKIFAFSKDKNVCQAGGVLLGNIVKEDGIVYVMIMDFIEALHCESTSNSITFTKETWNYIDEEKEKNPQYEIVGWMHTNPDTGCGATEYDAFLHSHMFEKENMVEYIVDPVQIVEAFYFLEDGSMKRSDGFYLFMATKSRKAKRHKNKHSEKEPELIELEIIDDEAKPEEVAENNEKEDVIEEKEAENKDVERKDVPEKEIMIPSYINGEESHNAGEISGNMDISKVNIPERTSLKMKVLVSILTVIVIGLIAAVAVMAMRITQLEKDINKLYENDEVIARYINGEEETTAEEPTEEATEKSEDKDETKAEE